MTQGIDVNVGADTREFASSVKSGMQDPVEDAQKALDEYVKAGDSAGDDLTRSFSDQQRATTELRTNLDQLNDTIRSGTKRATQSAGDDQERFAKRTEDGLDEVKESAKSNAIQLGASFTGGFDQAAGGLQGFISEFLAGFGPAGVLAGVAAASVIGIITSQVDAGTEAAEAQKAAVQALGQEYIDAGQSGTRSFDSVKSAISAMATSTDGSDVIITLQKAWEAAQTSGADYQQVVEAIASSQPAEIQKALNAVNRLQSAHASLSQTTTDYAGRLVSTNTDQILSNQTLREALKKAEDQATQAGRAQELAAAAGISDLQLKSDLIGQLAKSYDDVAGDVDSYLNKEKTVLDVKKYIHAMEQRQKALESYQEDLAKANLSPEAVKFLESQGADSAAAMLRGYQKASPRQQAQLNDIWKTAGDDNADTYSSALGKKISGIKTPAPVILTPVVPAPNTQALDAYIRSPKVVKVAVDLVTRNGKRIG